MRQIPPPALALGFAGLLPFLAGALAAHGLMPGISNPITGLLILQGYGAAILAFMGGCLWGFASQASRAGWKELGLAAAPGLWAAWATFANDALLTLILGFIALLGADLLFRAWGLGPRWWMALRVPLTIGVVICLGLGRL